MCILDIHPTPTDGRRASAATTKLPIASLLPGLTTLDCAAGGATPLAAARYLDSLAAGKPCTLTESTGCPSMDFMTLRRAPGVALSAYIEEFCTNALVEQTALITAVAYVRRLVASPVPHHHDRHHTEGVACQQCPAAHKAFDVNPCNVHRVFAACAVIACKFVNDRVYPMSFYASQLQLKPEDLRKLEGELCRLLNFNLVVRGEEFNAASSAISATLVM